MPRISIKPIIRLCESFFFRQTFNAKIYCVHAALEDDNEMDEIEMRKVRNYLLDTMLEPNIECGILETMDMQQGFENFIKEQQYRYVGSHYAQAKFL